MNSMPALLLGLAAVPAAAQYEPPKQMTLSPLGVDLSDGRFTYKAKDLSIGPFTLERSFIGGHTIDGSNYFGPNWTHNYAIYVVEKELSKSNGVYVVLGRGTVHFSFATYGCWHNDCEGASLTLVNGAFVYTDAQGNVYTFNPAVYAFGSGTGLRRQRIARIDYADGHTLTYTYSGQQLRQIASNYGYSLVFEYSGSTNSVSKACGYNRAVTPVAASTTCDDAALAVSYSYAPNGNVANVVDPLNRHWGYDYGDTGAKLNCVRQVNSSACQIANTYQPLTGVKPHTVTSQTTADGAVWYYQWAPVSPDDQQLPGQPPLISTGGYTGPEGIQVGAQFGGGLLDYYGVNGRLTYLQWDGFNLGRLYHPEGNNVSYGWRAGQQIAEAWEAKQGSGLAPVGKSLGFAEGSHCPSGQRKICNKPIWKKDYRQSQTDFTYDPTHGGLLTETGPAVNGIQPQVRYTYAPRRAWVSNGGGYVQESAAIYLPVTKSVCMTGNASGAGCAISGDEVVTTYDYGPDSGPNNLLLRSETVTAGGVSRRTCYGYDWMGNRISTTRPKGLCQ